MKNWLFGFVFVFALAMAAVVEEAQGESLLADVSDNEAEQLYAEGSFQKAYQKYLSLKKGNLSQAQRSWRDFRIIDCDWRAKASVRQRNNIWIEESNSRFKSLIEKINVFEDQDFIIASIHESLGDLNSKASGRYARNKWSMYYVNALDFWARSEPTSEATSKYLSITKRLFSSDSNLRNFGRYFTRQRYSYDEIQILRNALSLADSDEDIGIFTIYLANSYRSSVGNGDIEKALKLIDKSIEKINGGIWLWRVLYVKAQVLENTGRPFRLETGQWGYEPDFVGALEIYKKIINSDKQNETGLVNQIQSRITNIQKPEINVLITGFYKSKNDIQFYLSSKNIEKYGVKIFPLDLSSRINLKNGAISTRDLAKYFITPDTREVFEKNITNDNFREHRSKRNTVSIDGGLPTGSYMVVAESNGIIAKQLLLVTDAMLVTQTHPQGVSYMSVHAESGKPILGADISVIRGIRSNNRNSEWSYRRFEFKSDEFGFIDLNQENVPDLKGSRLLVFGDTQMGPVVHYNYSSNFRGATSSRDQKYYVFSDRPAYRPGEIVKWKALSRLAEAGFYTIPENAQTDYVITNPRGQEIEKGKLKLNDYGSVSMEFIIPIDATLGNYTLRLKPSGEKSWRSYDTLFRLEEYKLPDFKVEVVVPESDGVRKIFKPGEPIEMDVSAQYYFGAPVKNADVEIVVLQNRWYSGWLQPRPEPWFMDSGQLSPPFQGGGKEILRKTLKTDSDGIAQLRFAPQNLEPGTDYKFSVEARVTDSSRIMVRGEGEVKVTERKYFTRANLKHKIHKPGDLVEVEWHFRDANENSYSPRGQILISKQIKNPDFTKPIPQLNKAGAKIYPPFTQTPEFIMEKVELVKAQVENGEYLFQWRPRQPGIYQFQWIGDQVPMYLDEKVNVTAWVLKKNQSTVSYRSGGVEIILDQKSVLSGEECLFILSASKPNAYVWLAFENGNEWTQKLIQIKGNAAIQRYKVDPMTARNFFIHAVSVRDFSAFRDQEEVIVPPLQKIAKLEITPNENVVRPGSNSKWTVKVSDHEGQPLVGELALAIYDKSIDYIQKDTSKPIEKFFYGDRSYSTVRFQSMLNFGQFQNLHKPSPEGNEDPVANGLKKGVVRRKSKTTPRLDFANRSAAPASNAFFSAQPLAEESMMMGQAADSLQSVSETVSSPVGDNDEVFIRSNFDKTAFWSAHIITDKEGKAEIEFQMPDSLTEWVAVGRFIDSNSIVAQSTSSVKANNPLSVRVEMPRYLISADEAILAASVLNQSESPQKIKFTWNIDSSLLSYKQSQLSVSASIEKGEERIFQIKVKADAVGDASIKAVVRSNDFSDGIEKSISILPHGFDKLDFKSGKITQGNALAKIRLPDQRMEDSTSMVIRVTPSMAVTMLDALPYLVQFPYGSTEQTMSRFVPAVVVLKTLTDFGLEKKDILNHLRGGIEKSYLSSRHNKSVGKIQDLENVIKNSLDIIYDFQKPSGGWGWWKRNSEDIYMTSYVVWGLSLAMDAGIDIDRAHLERGRNYLLNIIGSIHAETDLLAWTLRAIGESRVALNPNEKPDPKEVSGFNAAWKTHKEVSAYTRSLLALVAHNHGDKVKAEILVRNLENGIIKIDTSSIINLGIGSHTPAMHHWGKDGLFYRWSDSAVEGTSTAIEALTKINPNSPLLEPAVNWLLAQRRAGSWNNTKDTAISILSLASYVKESGELEKDLDVDVVINGDIIKNLKMDKASILKGSSSVTVPVGLLGKDDFNVEIRNHTQKTPFYYNIETRYYSLEKPIQPSGNTIFAKRSVSKIKSVKTLLMGYRDSSNLLGDRPISTSGDRINVTVRLENKVDLEYVMVEDFKPAGLEFTKLKSGGGILLAPMHKDTNGRLVSTPGRKILAYNEWRDDRCVLFIDKLPAGVWSLDYEARAQVPGTFHGLPVKCEATYVPEIKGNSLEQVWSIGDKK